MQKGNQQIRGAYIAAWAIGAALVCASIAEPAAYTDGKTTADDSPHVGSSQQQTATDPNRVDIAGCNGLGREHWQRWRDSYSQQQFEQLLEGTIAPTVKEAEKILFSKEDLFGNSSMVPLQVALLANQLTLKLTEQPDIPNPEKAELKRSCRLVAGCDPRHLKGFVDGCGIVKFKFTCDLGYWMDLASDISQAHRKSGCAKENEFYECSEFAFEAGYLYGEVEAASCVLTRFADRKIVTAVDVPGNPY